ncbi:MAG TPA: Na+/H+ antiporter subunit E [Acidimicrobiales bacterium]|jgi:multisubunit Na+/H+ antiporter MnhE subunit|nr:Na+/H+ antiporter subunit E [Acidimicrobiales bacterium]
MADRGGRLGTWSFWFGVCFLLWLVLTSTVAWNEVATGVVAAAIAAVVATLVRPRPPLTWRSLPGGWRAAAVLPWRIISDTGVAVAALFWRLRGRQVGHLIELATDIREPADQALAALLVTVSPNHVLVDFDASRGTALVHTLGRRPQGSLEDLLRHP